MNTGIFFLVAAIGLTGCTAMEHHRTGGARDGGSPAYADEPEQSHPSTGEQQAKPHGPYVRDLPKDAEAALAKAGVKDIAVLAAIDAHGTVRLLVPDDVEQTEFRLPKKLVLQTLTPMSLMTFKGSNCAVLVNGVRVKGTWDSGHPEQGASMMGFCRKAKSIL